MYLYIIQRYEVSVELCTQHPLHDLRIVDFIPNQNLWLLLKK